MWEGCLECVGRLYEGCEEAVCGVMRMSGPCREAVWMVWQGCLEGVERLSGGVGGCLVVRGDCQEGIGRLSGDVVGCQVVWGDCLKGEGRLFGGCRKTF